MIIPYDKPTFWHSFLSAVTGTDAQPPLQILRNPEGETAEHFVVITNPFDHFRFAVSENDIIIIRNIGGETVGVWQAENPPILSSIITEFQAQGLIQFDRPVVPSLGLAYYSAEDASSAGGQKFPMRKERLLLCDDGIVFVALSEAQPLIDGLQNVTYSVAGLPVRNWWNFQMQTSADQRHVTSAPVRENAPIFQGNAGLPLRFG